MDGEMNTPRELRDMSDEQLDLTAQEAAQQMFKLRIRTQTDKLNTPSEIRRNRRLIARVKTIQTQRAMAAVAT
jgi:large subunit ribosomal protein L29